MEPVQRRDRAIGKLFPGIPPQGNGLAGRHERHEIEPFDRLGDGVHRSGAVAKEGLQVDEAARTIQRTGQGSECVGSVQGLQLRAPGRRSPPALRRTEIENDTAADGAAGGGVADDESIASRGGNRLIEHKLNQLGFAWRDRLVAQYHDARRHLASRMIQPHRHPLTDRLRLRPQHAKPRIDASGGRVQRWVEHDVAAPHSFLSDAGPGQGEGAALARMAHFGGAVLHMQRAHARLEARRADDNAVADLDPTGQHGPGHDRPRADQGEGTVDRQPEPAVRPARLGGAAQTVEPGSQRRNPFTGQRRNRQDLRTRQVCRSERCRDIAAHLETARVIGQVRLGQNHDAAR
ncbi:MAG TPA: hypothetical protein VFE34_01765 [Dongiaceae bacterium]|nr:hypothetical protein [Dongiaceae bacterium]